MVYMSSNTWFALSKLRHLVLSQSKKVKCGRTFMVMVSPYQKGYCKASSGCCYHLSKEQLQCIQLTHNPREAITLSRVFDGSQMSDTAKRRHHKILTEDHLPKGLKPRDRPWYTLLRRADNKYNNKRIPIRHVPQAHPGCYLQSTLASNALELWRYGWRQG